MTAQDIIDDYFFIAENSTEKGFQCLQDIAEATHYKEDIMKDVLASYLCRVLISGSY